jgi:hypothetical protein
MWTVVKVRGTDALHGVLDQWKVGVAVAELDTSGYGGPVLSAATATTAVISNVTPTAIAAHAQFGSPRRGAAAI